MSLNKEGLMGSFFVSPNHLGQLIAPSQVKSSGKQRAIGSQFVSPSQIRQSGRHLGSKFVSPAQLGQMNYEIDVPFGKTAIMDQWVDTPNAAWGDEAFDAPDTEDINVMGPQGGDDMLGMGQTTVPATPDQSTDQSASVSAAPPAVTPAAVPAPTGVSMSAQLGAAIVIGGIILLAWHAWSGSSEADHGLRAN